MQQLALAHHCCILVLTHLRKSGNYGRANDGGDPFEEVTGSMGLPSKADTIMVFKKIANSNEGKLYMRGRETKEQTLELDFVNGLWYVKDHHNMTPEDEEETISCKYYNELLEYLTESEKKHVKPSEFGRWYLNTYGQRLTNPSMVLKRLYSKNMIDMDRGKYCIKRKR